MPQATIAERCRCTALVYIMAACLALTSSVSHGEESLPFDCGRESFTIVGVPDTQGYWGTDDHLLESFRFVLEQRALWDASAGAEGCNIVFVTGYFAFVNRVAEGLGVELEPKWEEHGT